MFVLRDAGLRELILALETDLSIFPAGMTMRLFTNNFTPDKNSILADFTELTGAAVPGYLSVAPLWSGTPTRNQDGSWEDLLSVALFQATGNPAAPTVVYGWFLTNPGNTIVFGSGAFVVPFTFVKSGDGVNLQGRILTKQDTGTSVDLTLDMEEEV